MGVITRKQELTASVAPSRMFKALFLDSHNLIPKLCPEGIKSIDIVQGDGGVGTIRQTNFQEGSPIKCVKHKIDAIDENNYCFKQTMIEGDGPCDKFESVVQESKFEKCGEGCVCKMTSQYHTKCDVKDEEIDDAEEKAKRTFMMVEQHLKANPHLYG